MKNADELPIKGIHHLEFYVGNAKQADYFYRNAFGFSRVAYAGPETGLRDRASYVLEQGKVRFVFTTPLTPDGPVAEHIRRHGDAVADIALEVEDADGGFRAAVERGGKAAFEPRDLRDDGGSVRVAGVRTYGDTVHSLIARNGFDGPFLPRFIEDRVPGEPVGILKVDHVVGNVELGRMNDWVEYYEKVFGFYRFLSFDDKDISTAHSALMSKVMSSGTGLIKFPINEPAPALKKSQIEEYLDFNLGAGVQHVALLTADIRATVTELRRRGVEFLEVPRTYYDEVVDRVGEIEEPMDEIADLGILVDRDEEGYLLQLFTKPVEDRPTLFYEIIQRKGSQSFGKGNFKALFEAIEREQARRGNL